jgi:hypothetical protein
MIRSEEAVTMVACVDRGSAAGGHQSDITASRTFVINFTHAARRQRDHGGSFAGGNRRKRAYH